MDRIGRAGNLNQWTRGGERAPHKPLLTLYALGCFQRYPEAALRYSDVERDPHGLLRAYEHRATRRPRTPSTFSAAVKSSALPGSP